MKNFLIAAGMAVMLMGAAPAVAAPAGDTPGISAPQNWNGRDNRRDDRRDDRRDRRNDRNDRRDWNRGRHNGWGNGWGNRCHNVRRHHRWVRVCGRR